MSDFIPMTCPSCDGKLQITEDMEYFTCLHCKTRYAVRRGVGTVSLDAVTGGLKDIQSGAELTISELGIKRLTEEIALYKKLTSLLGEYITLDNFLVKGLLSESQKDIPKEWSSDLAQFKARKYLKKFISIHKDKGTGILYSHDAFIEDQNEIASSREGMIELRRFFLAEVKESPSADKIYVDVFVGRLNSIIGAYDAIEIKQVELKELQEIVRLRQQAEEQEQ